MYQPNFPAILYANQARMVVNKRNRYLVIPRVIYNGGHHGTSKII